MRVHLFPVGFTPEVFTSKTSPLIRLGAQRIIALHSTFGGPNEDSLVESTIKEIENVAGLKVERVVLTGHSFFDFVKGSQQVLDQLENDEVYVHLGGGERFLSLSLVYAAFFSTSTINFVTVVEMQNGKKFTYEIVPSLKVNLPSKSQMKLINALGDTPLRLFEIAKKLDYTTAQAGMAGVSRHLKNLKKTGFIKVHEGKSYSLTSFGQLLRSPAGVKKDGKGD